jgi:membrane-bound lytic murein transglycosylase B
MMLKKSAPGSFNSQAWYRHLLCAKPGIQSKKYVASARRFSQLFKVDFQQLESSAPHKRPCAPVLLLNLVLMVALPVTAFAVSLDAHPELQSFIQAMVTNHGFSERKLNNWFRQTNIQQDIIRAINTPKEALPWYEYRKLFVTKPSANRGQRFWKNNANALSMAQREYGVDPATIVAIIGVETQYGRNTGRYRVLDALTTLTLKHPPRRKFFRSELEAFLLLTRELQTNPLKLRGSYAGAMGVPQFIPSSYRQYAIDFNGDGRRDIIGNVTDAIGSVANFLKAHGWQKGGAVIERLELEEELVVWLEKIKSSPMPPLQYLLGYGILPVQYNDGDPSTALIRLEGESGPVYHLGYNNFYVITRYNRSRNYAMAVFELSEWIRRLYKAR